MLTIENNKKKPHRNTYGGGKSMSDGRALISVPGHPRAHKQGHYVYEHIIIAEAALGKFLPKEAIVHHFDGDKRNNTPNNLVICQDNDYHRLLHIRTRALKGYGNVNARKCTFCKQWDIPENLILAVRSNRKGVEVFYKNCKWSYERDRYRRHSKAKKHRGAVSHFLFSPHIERS